MKTPRKVDATPEGGAHGTRESGTGHVALLGGIITAALLMTAVATALITTGEVSLNTFVYTQDPGIVDTMAAEHEPVPGMQLESPPNHTGRQRSSASAHK